MAKHKRKPAKGKPITSHQLFPAVVALWFGALFGLGSLAVRPSLLEGLVLKSHLDLVIPAAAPPLGVTARILVALILAALGAVLGLVLARRIARPKPVVTERKRSARDLGRERADTRPHYADASTRPPVVAREDAAEGPNGGGVLANRRRSLAIEHEEEDFVPHDMAPLPGGNPQIFDISELGIANVQSAAESLSVASAEPTPAAPAPSPVSLDWSNAAPVAAPAAIEAQRQVFQTEPAAVLSEVPVACPAIAAAHADGRQVFGMTPPAPPSEGERECQIFGVVASAGHVPQEFVQAAGFKTTVFDQEEHEPLFTARETEPAPVAGPAVGAAPVPQAFEPAPQPAPAPAATLEAPAAEEELPSPGSLGMSDLAARLAESMRRRRAARAAPAAEVAAPPAMAQAAPVPEVPAASEVPAAFEPAPLVAAAAIPSAYEPPFEPAAPAEPAPTSAPPFAEAPTAAALPRAMQPLALDAFLEEDALPDLSLLPPRHIAMPAAPIVAAPVVAAQASQPEPSAPEPAPLELGAEEELLEEASYASLLEVAPARNPFVRIEESTATPTEIEPVVIFPGQAPVQPASFQSAPFAAGPEAAPFRRFDSPGSAEQGQQVAANLAAPAVDPGEAERALRAALSNLQRMSGAA